MGIGLEPLQGITTQPVGRIIVEPWLKAPLPPISQAAKAFRVPSFLSVPLLAISVIGLLGGDKARDDSLAKMGMRYNPSTGLAEKITQAPYTPPFTGGQSLGIEYRLEFTRTTIQSPFGGVGTRVRVIRDDIGNTVTAPVTGINLSPVLGTSGELSFTVYHSGGVHIARNGGGTYSYNSAYGQTIYSYSNIEFKRRDGQTDTGGNLPNPNPVTTSQIPSGYAGSNGETLQEKQKNVLPARFSPALGWGNSQLSPRVSLPALGIGRSKDPATLLPPPTANPLPKSPLGDPVTPKRSPLIPSKELPEKKKDTPFIPLPPSDLKVVNDQIALLGGALGIIGQNITDVKSQTSPANQVQNAKTGNCQALNDPSCTNGLKNDIVNPLGAKLDAAQIARDRNAAAQSAALTGIAVEQQAQKRVLASIGATATNIFDMLGKLWNNSLVDKAMQYITMITVIHNAAMLSSSIGDTLGSALDSGLQALRFPIKDKDGQQQGVTAIIGKSFQDLIKGIVGTENFAALNETWAKGNRIYQATTNLASNFQSLLDSATAVAELTSNRVATLMNSLRNAGMVREDAYGSQTPNTTRFNAYMQKMENLEQGVSNLASITSNVVSVQQSVDELKANRAEFQNAIQDKNATEESAKAEKREESVFKIGDFTIVRPPETSP